MPPSPPLPPPPKLYASGSTAALSADSVSTPIGTPSSPLFSFVPPSTSSPLPSSAPLDTVTSLVLAATVLNQDQQGRFVEAFSSPTSMRVLASLFYLSCTDQVRCAPLPTPFHCFKTLVRWTDRML